MAASGETLDSLYRYGDQGEIEDVVGSWLRATIQRLEEERRLAESVLSKPPESIKITITPNKYSPRSTDVTIEIPAR